MTAGMRQLSYLMMTPTIARVVTCMMTTLPIPHRDIEMYRVDMMIMLVVSLSQEEVERGGGT